jgi:hypothetical protein
MISKWWKSDSIGYHSYKIANAQGYALSNTI